MCVSIAKCYPLFSHPLTDHVGRGVGCDHREDAVTLVWVPRLVIITARVEPACTVTVYGVQPPDQLAGCAHGHVAALSLQAAH